MQEQTSSSSPPSKRSAHCLSDNEEESEVLPSLDDDVIGPGSPVVTGPPVTPNFAKAVEKSYKQPLEAKVLEELMAKFPRPENLDANLPFCPRVNSEGKTIGWTKISY